MHPSPTAPAWLTWLGAALVILVFGLPLFRGLDHLDMHNDEASYSYGVQRILETNDWMTVRGTPTDMEFLEKPPLKFWLVAGAMRTGLLPQTDVGMRWLDALFGSAVFLYVYLLGCRVSGPIAGLVAAVVLFTCEPLIMDHGLRSNNMEAALTLAYCAGFYHALAWLDAGRGPRRHGHAFGVTLAFVLGFMTKFVVIAFLPLGAMFLAATHPSRGQLFTRDRLLTWVLPALLAAAIIAPWFVYQTWRLGAGFWQVILGQQVLERMSTGLDRSHIEPAAFYLTRLWSALSAARTLPLVLAGLAWSAIMSLRRETSGGRLLLCWSVVPLVAISASHSKIIHYAFPFVPPLAIGAGWVIGAAAQWVAQRMVPTAGADLGRSALRWALLAAGIAAMLLAGYTLTHDRVEWHLPQGGVLTNSSVLRPLAVGALLLLAAFRRWRALLLVPALLVLSALMPFRAYGRTLDAIGTVYRPLAAVNTCLRNARDRGARLPTQTYLVSGYPPTHAYVYYLREFGDYMPHTGDRDLAQELQERLTPERQSFLLMTRDDYRRWRDRFPGLANATAVMAENEFVLVLVLPGATAACAVDALQAGALGVSSR